MATGSAHVEIVVTTKTTKPSRLEALEQLEDSVGHFLRTTTETNARAYNELYGAYRTARETK